MNEAFLAGSQIWLICLLGAVVVVLLRGGTATRRILALDLASLLLIAVLVLFSLARSSPFYLDAALVLGLLGFLAVLRLARHLQDEERDR